MKQHKYMFSGRLSTLFILFLCLTASILRGQTIYTGPNNGDWETGTNWDNGLPRFGNDATIPATMIVCINDTLIINFGVQNFGTILNKSMTTISTNLLSGGALSNAAGASLTVQTGVTLTSSGGFTNAGTLSNSGNINSNSLLSNVATGIINNSATFTQQGVAINDGVFNNLAGIFSSPTPFTNNKIVNNSLGATWKVDFGGAFSNAVGSTFTNAGAAQNLGTFTNNTMVTNTGTFTNNGLQDCLGTFNNNAGGQLASTGTFNLSGRLNNAVGAMVTNSNFFNVLTNGYLSNASVFNNNATVDINANGTFINDVNATMPTGFGSVIQNAGYLKNNASATISGNGEINNSRKLDNYGTVDVQNGAKLINSDSICNYALIRNVNTITNSGEFINKGIIENNSGGVWINTSGVLNDIGGTIANNYEIYNRPTATFTNNGTLANAIRFFNEGSFINNAYLVTTGDFFNRVGAIFTNTEVVEIKEGSIVNEGVLNNQKLFFNNSCSILSNKATINNTGRLESWGIVFQRGTVTGTPIVANGGFVQTAPTSNAPSICRDTVKTGVDPDGEAKVYGQNPLKAGLGIDQCAGFQYFVANTTRKVYNCSFVGQTVTEPFKLLTRTGDSLTCTLKITIFDNVPPTISGCPKDVVVLTDQNTATYAWAAPTAIDNCASTPVIATTNASGSSFPLGITEVILTATDASNVRAECRFKVDVQRIVGIGTCTTTDITPPVFSNCPANQTLTTQTGFVAAVWNTPSVSDACLPIALCVTANSGQLFQVGTTSISYIATDAKNNTSTCSFTITVTGNTNPCATDNIPPVISNCPGNFFTTLNVDINGGASVWATPDVSDNCTGAILTSDFQSGQIFPLGNTVVTYTAKDALDNTATCSFTVNVAATNPCAGDLTLPTITCPANVSVNTTNGFATATWVVPTASDNCGIPSLNGTHTPGQNFGLGVTTLTYAASDANGNRKTCTFTVTVSDQCYGDIILPSLSPCPANQTVTGSTSSGTATWIAPTATDNCNLAGLTANYQSGATFPIGTTTIVYTATDKSGNRKTCSFTISITVNNPCAADITPPSFGATCPTVAPLTSINGACVTTTWTAPTATDNCGTPSVSSTHAVGFCFPVGTTTVAYTATDAKNNKATCNISITVNNPCTADITPPSFGATCPTVAPLTSINGACVAATWTAPTATDNCGIPSVSSTHAVGFCFPVGTTTVTYTATDAKNNKATCNISITVNNPCAADITPPSFGATCPTVAPLTSINGACVAATWTAPTATDNCGIPSVSSTHAVGFCFPVGTTTVSYTATDAKNNKATCNISITVNNPCTADITPPSFGATCPTVAPLTSINGACVTTTWTAPTATDNCGIPSVSSTHAVGFCFPVGTTTVSYTATDAKNNKATCNISITVNNPCAADITPPSFGATCPIVAPLTSTNGACITTTWTAPTATDNCGTPSVSSTHAVGFCFPVGTTTVTYTATDAKNNKATCSFTITVANRNGSCIGNLISNFGFESDLAGYQNWDHTNITKTDVASGVKAAKVGKDEGGFGINHLAATPGLIYTFKVKAKVSGTPDWVGSGICFWDANWKKLDERNVTITAITYQEYTVSITAPANTRYVQTWVWKRGKSSYLYTDDWCLTATNPCINDITPPTITCPANQTVNQSPTCSTASWSVATATDNCGIPSVAQVSGTASGGCFPLGTSTVSYKATDTKGLQATCSFYITVLSKPYSVSNCNGNGEQLIFKGAIDYLAIGNTMSQKEDRSNCAQNASSAKSLSLPADAVVKAAYLYWSGSGSLDNTVSLNGTTVSAQGSKTFYEPSLAISFFAARADVTSLVRNSGTYTVNNLTWHNTGNYCQANSAYGAWSIVVVYEQVSLPLSTIHINADKFQYTYPAANYNTYINCVKVPTGVASNAKLTIVSFEGDNYKGEDLYIGGVHRGNNNFRGQSGPNLDILTFDVASVVNSNTTSLNYYVRSYLTNTIWGSAIEGLFDYVKILKYNTGSSITANLVSNTANDLLQITARAESNRVRIEWLNNTGAKNDYFTVEKLNASTGNFEKLEQVNNQSPTNETAHYGVYDNAPTAGENTYRIKAMYLDGLTKVSETKTLDFKGLEGVSIFPNPANDVLNVDLKRYEGKAVSLYLYNAMGQLAATEQIEKATALPYEFSISNMPVGSYRIRIAAQGIRDISKTVIINR